MATLTVNVATDGNPGIGRELRSFRQYPAAKRFAERHADDYHYGTVIVDHDRGIADWGNGWFRADDSEAAVDAPAYAKEG